MKIYQDKRGWRFSVKTTIGGGLYKRFYLKPGALSWHAVRVLPWHSTKQEAQDDLDAYAEKHGMKVYEGD